MLAAYVVFALIPIQLAAECVAPAFRAPVRYAVAADEVVLAADLDRDGAPDIMTSGNQVDELSTFSILRNPGTGNFETEQQIQSSFGERLEDVADLNGDGILDLVVSNYWQNGIAIYRGLGSLRFSSGTAFGTATHGGPSRAVDYDHDGRTDVVSFSFGSGNPVRVHLFRGHGDGAFDAKQTFETGIANAASPSTRVREGKVELLVDEHSGHLRLLRILDNEISTTTIDAGPGLDLTSTFSDVNGDGTADIVETNDGGGDAAANPFEWIFIRLGNPDGSFGDRRQLMQPRRMSFPTELRAGDFDGDGIADLAASDFHAATIYFFRGRGTGDFDAGLPIDAGGPINDLAAADFNGDGRLDLATANDNHSVSIIINDGGIRCFPNRRRAVRH
jgi:hypothetical protein